MLDTLRPRLGDRILHFWRDKSGREVDFVVKRMGRQMDAVECKIHPDRFDPSHLLAFREHYGSGNNYVVCPFLKSAHRRRMGGAMVHFVPHGDLYGEGR